MSQTINFNKVCEPARLKMEIEASAITVALDTIVVSAGVTSVHFKAVPSAAEETILTDIITAHIPTPLPNEAAKVQIEATPPFAKPDYRTKWGATPTVIEMAADEEETIDYVLPEERYCHGGEIVFTGVHIGDWLEAYIVDANGVIPVPYRTLIGAEDYPILATYIEKYYLKEGVGTKELNTYPLNAKITQGLVLRVKIHTCSTVGDRKFAVNYFLTKKMI